MDFDELSPGDELTVRQERARRRGSEAFRRRLEKRRTEEAETRKLQFVASVASLIWLYVGIQCFAHR